MHRKINGCIRFDLVPVFIAEAACAGERRLRQRDPTPPGAPVGAGHGDKCRMLNRNKSSQALDGAPARAVNAPFASR